MLADERCFAITFVALFRHILRVRLSVKDHHGHLFRKNGFHSWQGRNARQSAPYLLRKRCAPECRPQIEFVRNHLITLKPVNLFNKIRDIILIPGISFDDASVDFQSIIQISIGPGGKHRIELLQRTFCFPEKGLQAENDSSSSSRKSMLPVMTTSRSKYSIRAPSGNKSGLNKQILFHQPVQFSVSGTTWTSSGKFVPSSVRQKIHAERLGSA